MQPKEYKTNRWGFRRIILTNVVGDAWERMQEEHYRNVVQKGFRAAPSINLAL